MPSFLPQSSARRRGISIATLLLSFLSVSSSWAGSLLEKQDAILRDAPVPPPPIPVAGGFFGRTGNTYVVAGGHGDSLEIWTANVGGEGWKAADVSVPAFAAVAQSGAAWIVAGGLVEGRPVRAVQRLSWNGGALTTEALPDLPVDLAGAAAAVIGSKVYVAGGVVATEPVRMSRRLWILDLKTGGGWQAGTDLPGEARALFAATEQYGTLCLFGGRAEDGRILTESWIYRPKPLEGTAETGWKRMSDMPVPSARAAALPVGQAQVVILGGETTPGRLFERTTASPPGPALLFHTLTDAWSGFAADPGIAFPVAVRTNGDIVILGESNGQPAAVEMGLRRIVRSLQWLDYTVIVLYFVILAWIGFSFSRQESSEEFSLGNRKVKWWAAGLSMFATGASAISFMAIPALSFATNLVWLFPLIAFVPGFFVTAYFIFPMLRRLEITSTYEYLERRFNRTLRLISSLQSILFQTFARTSVVLVLPALAISAVTGINVYASVLVMGILTTVYTAVGGFEAVIWTEVFQAALMLFAPIAIIFVCIAGLPGGVGEFVSIGSTYGKFDFALLTWDVAVPAVWILLLMQFVTCTVAAAGDQPVIQRVFSAPLAEVRKVNAMSTVCGIGIGILVNVMGLAIFAYFHANPQKFDPMAQNDQVVPMFVAQAMPVGMAGLIIAAIFAASMSTVASIMNSVATLFTEDFFMRFRKQATDRQRLICLKATSYTAGAIGILMALTLAAQDIKSMMVVWSQLAALLGGGIVGVYSLGMFTQRANGFGAICGALASIAVALLVKAYTPLHWATYLPIAILTCIVVGYLCSLLAPQRKNLEGLTIFTPAVPKT